jgi:hypothetical protein
MPNHRPISEPTRRFRLVKRLVRIGPALLGTLALLPLAGCMAYSHSERDVDRTPIVNIGSRASIIYPGQAAPGFPTLQPPPGTTGAQSYSSQNGPNGQSGQGQYTGSPGQPSADPLPAQPPPPHAQSAYQPAPAPRSDPNAGMVMLGGAREDITQHTSIREDPLFMKYLMAPLVVAAAPFVLAKEAIVGEPEPGPALPRPPNPTSRPTQPPPPQAQHYEERMMQNMSRELSERQVRQERDATQQALAPEARRTTASASSSGQSSIAAELEALRRTPDLPSRGQQNDREALHDQTTPSRASNHANATTADGARRSFQPRAESGPNTTTADGIVDRNNDGRIDQWIYRSNGEIEREELDEDFDGHVDRIIHIDLASHQIRLVEEDNGGGGAIDTWTEYRQGAIARRRADSDGDGSVDTWSFYHSGELVRHEQDTTHDGFRDAITFYQQGNRLRETRDIDADGESDVELFYDENDQVVRREEDHNSDGAVEVISHYRNGRLVRKELLDAPELAAQDSDTNSLR